MAVDPTFELDDFKKAKVLTETETKVRNMLMLLYGKPGFYPSIPELGMNIKQYLYSFADGIDTDAIKAELAYQCRDFLPDIESGEMEVLVKVYNERPLLLFILPTVINNRDISVALGVTLNDRGEMIYNFQEQDVKITL